MAERGGKKIVETLEPLIKTVEFFGAHVIDVRKPSSVVTLAPHTILDGMGNDKNILCPSTQGVVHVSKYEGYADLHQISIICESAYVTGIRPDGAPHQCHRKTKTLAGHE